MQAHTVPRAIAAGAVLAAAALVLLTRTPSADLPAVVVPAEIAADEPAVAELDADAAPASADSLADAKIRELEAMSETFRNTTFLIAIRDAGFVCHELLRVYGGVDDSAQWMATCSEMLAYTVAVARDGTLRVEPFLQYFDGVAPRVIDRDFDAPRQPAQPLPPTR
jgi:hypothetical protein